MRAHHETCVKQKSNIEIFPMLLLMLLLENCFDCD